MPARDSFYAVLTDAINDLMEHGFDSQRRVADWTRRISEAINRSLPPATILDAHLRDALITVFNRASRADKVFKTHKGLSRFTWAQIQPKLRLELDRHVVASANLIKLNREEMKAKTLRRFQGWATSVPAGGTAIAERGKIRKDIRRTLSGLPFEERRVLIDQGHKLAASVNRVIAEDGGAIAMEWASHAGEAGYDFRPEHAERAGNIYGLRDSWAHKEGYIKRGKHGWYDEITAVGEEVFCRCWASRWLYSLSEIERFAPDMLTEKGRAKLREVQMQMRGLGVTTSEVSHAAH